MTGIVSASRVWHEVVSISVQADFGQAYARIAASTSIPVKGLLRSIHRITVMSIENVQAFNQRLVDDEAVKERFAALAASDVDAVVSYAQELGYSFTKDELVEVATKALEEAKASNQLSEQELESVAGGTIHDIPVKSYPYWPMTPITPYLPK